MAMSDSSSEDEVDVLQLINPEASKAKTKSPTPVSKAETQVTRSSSLPPLVIRNQAKRLTRSETSPFRSSSDDEFELDIPAIFKTHARDNERLLNNHDKLQEQIDRSNEKVKREYQDILQRKTALIDELNDNGSRYRYSLSNTGHKSLIESLVKKSLKKNAEFQLNRHFFFMKDVYEVDIETDFKVSKASIPFLFKDEQSLSNLLNMTDLKNILDIALCKIDDLNMLKVVQEFFVKQHTRRFGDFSKYVEVLGCNTPLQDHHTIKLVYFRLLAVNLVFAKTFTNNHNNLQNQQNYTQIKKQNYTNLSNICKILHQMRDNFHNQSAGILGLPNEINEFYDKDTISNMVTDIYYLLNYLHTILKKDTQLVQNDVFYD
ncbi:hypothetical protein QCA50_015963 [Cerrena zonata]|uniref:Uncharacterized protein n=1 Tax=Cerrena zonata TaxID=2478898 RepID=A0AAW0FTN6_9APHY